MKNFDKLSMVKMLDNELKEVVGGVTQPVLRYAIIPLYGIKPEPPRNGKDPVIVPLYGIITPEPIE